MARIREAFSWALLRRAGCSGYAILWDDRHGRNDLNEGGVLPGVVAGDQAFPKEYMKWQWTGCNEYDAGKSE